jgi:hypothetical protein
MVPLEVHQLRQVLAIGFTSIHLAQALPTLKVAFECIPALFFFTYDDLSVFGPGVDQPLSLLVREDTVHATYVKDALGHFIWVILTGILL